MSFSDKQFVIAFDEYVVIKDAESNILVSPPMKQKPDYSTKGRSIVVKIKDSLQPNTTYLFQFRDAIADYNEGNLLPSFEYVFSTGNTIDSMMITGAVRDGLSGEARKEPVTVLLLDSAQRGMMVNALGDTAIHKVGAAYATRCNKEGAFTFNHIRPGKYYVVALEDGDKNMMVGAGEPVAFADTTCTALAMPRQDTSARADSLSRRAVRNNIQLTMFEPDNQKQRIVNNGFVKANVLQVVALKPMKSPHVESGDEQVIWRLNTKGDTMTLWPQREGCDSLQLVVTDPTGLHDTLRLRYRRQRSMGTPGSLPLPNVKFNVKDKLDYYDTLNVLFTFPRGSWLPAVDSSVVIMPLTDSSLHYAALKLDSSLLKAAVDYTFLPGEKYQVRLLPGRSNDLYGKANDSLRATITITAPEDYGNIQLTVNPNATLAGRQLLVQLLNEKGAVVDSRIVQASQQLSFPHLKPGKYRFRVVVDDNANAQWDTGNFATLAQPEKVVYFAKTIDLRANWTFEENWEVGL